MLERLHLQSPRLPIVANVNGEFYPTGRRRGAEDVGPSRRQVASPGAVRQGPATRCTAPARASSSRSARRKPCKDSPRTCSASDGDVVSLFTNHPKFGDIAAFNQALCGLYAAGLGARFAEQADTPGRYPPRSPPAMRPRLAALTQDRYAELGRIFADVRRTRLAPSPTAR